MIGSTDAACLVPSHPPRRSLYAKKHRTIAADTSREHRQSKGVVIFFDTAKECISAPFRSSDKFCLLNDDHG